MKNYYKILGVEYSATDREIRDAYRRLAKKYHPDLNPGDADAAAKFRNVSEAHETLIDTERRVEHDYLLESKGISTGRFDKLDITVDESADEEEVKPTGEKPAGAAKDSAAKAKPAAPKKSMTREEKIAAAIARVREEKLKARRTMIIAVVAIGLVVLIALGIGAFFLFGGKKYTVTFDYGPAQAAQTVKINAGETVPEPAAPGLREGYVFQNAWYTAPDGGGIRINFSSYKPEGDITLYAHWVQIVSEPMVITLDYNGATENNTQVTATVIKGSWAWKDAVPVPARTGYTFDGWYIKGTSTRIIDPAVENTTQGRTWGEDITEITAQWTAIKTTVYRVWLNADGITETTLPNSQPVEFGTEPSGDVAIAPPPPGTKAGFKGWFTEKTGGKQITGADGKLLETWEVTSRTITLYAQYE